MVYHDPKMAMLVGAAGMMVPAPNFSGNRGPLYAPTSPYPPGVGNCGNGMPPCGPVDPNVAASLAAISCQAEQQQWYRAQRAKVLKEVPTIGLGISSDTRIGGGGGTGTNGAVAAGTSATLRASPSVPLCLIDLEIMRVSTPFFLILSMRAARQDYLADGVGIPADAFAPDSVHPTMEFPTLWPGTDITMIVFNLDAAERQFYGMLEGIPLGGGGPCL